MSAYVVILKSEKLIPLRRNCIQNPILNANSLVFHSPNIVDVPNFDLPVEYFFQPDAVACYNARILSEFGKDFGFFGSNKR